MGEADHISDILQSYKQDSRYLLAILLDIQEKERYLSVDAMRSVAAYLNVPESRVFAVATFYGTLSLEKKGAKLLRVCNGTACHLKGAASVVRKISDMLGVEPSETTADGEYTLEIVNCLGACALAPVVMADNITYGKIDSNNLALTLMMEKTS